MRDPQDYVSGPNMLRTVLAEDAARRGITVRRIEIFEGQDFGEKALFGRLIPYEEPIALKNSTATQTK